MSGQQRIYKQKIRSTQTLQKVFSAMEMIAASRVGKARSVAERGTTYDRALTQAVAAVSAHADMDHPLTSQRSDTNRVAVLVVTSDRGMAGAYSATILRETERQLQDLVEEGKEPILYVTGRRGVSYFNFRERKIVKSWTGQSDSPTEELAKEVADTLLASFLAPADEGGVSELHVIFTKFRSMVTQVPQVRKMLPIKVVDPEDAKPIEIDGLSGPDIIPPDVMPLYEFEPSPEEVLGALLPLYVRSRIRFALLQAAASELASRQNAMHTATENAEEIIRNYTRMANAARQAEITQEITEIVSGADALEAS
ncbi:MAG: F0F1 ATP synthase subunit gamma [Actinomycetaceae bacterium]|nr:F0F1 ATP synthase subunit gamma [Actinomycetaceae bacterium]